jgi:hypothetical protein
MNQEHVQSMIADYVLDLLTPVERLHVEEHTAACELCRSALQHEKQLALMISSTLHLATQPGNGRLQAALYSSPLPLPRRPVTGRRRLVIPRISVSGASWAGQLAPLTLVLLLLVSSLWVYLASPADPLRNPAPGYFVATEMAATATATATATSSATSSPVPSPPTSSPVATLAESIREQSVREQNVREQTAAPIIPDTPQGKRAATPVAQVMLVKGTN